MLLKAPLPCPRLDKRWWPAVARRKVPCGSENAPILQGGGPSGQQGPAHPQRCDTEACGMLRPPSGVPCSSHRLQHGGPDRHGGRTPTGREEPLTCLLGQTPAVHEAPLSPLHGSGILKVSDPDLKTKLFNRHFLSPTHLGSRLCHTRGRATSLLPEPSRVPTASPAPGHSGTAAVPLPALPEKPVTCTYL